MAEPTTDVPDEALNVDPERPQEGREALEAVLEAYGGDYADAAEYTDELEDVFETVVLVLASADDEDVEAVTEAVVTLVETGDALSSEGTVALAEGVGDNGEDLAGALESVLALQREGQLDDLVETAGVLADLEVTEESVAGMNRLLTAVGDAERDAEPAGLLDSLRALSAPDVRSGLGYLIAVLRSQGRQLRGDDRR